MELKAFLYALTSDWVVLMSGVASVVLAILGLARRWQSLPRWAFLLAAIACFFLASVRIWTTEYRARLDAEKNLYEQTQPQFSCEIDTTSVGYIVNDPSQRALVKLIVAIRNTGARSIAERYSLRLTFSDGSYLDGLPLTITEGYSWKYPNGTTEVMHRSDSLFEKTVQPIEHNSLVRGNLLYFFRGMTFDRAKAATQFQLGFLDIYGKPTTCTSRPDFSGPNPINEFPGMEPRFKPRP